jgi:hypothetical protein
VLVDIARSGFWLMSRAIADYVEDLLQVGDECRQLLSGGGVQDLYV